MKSPPSSIVAIVAMKRFEDAANNFLAPNKNKPPKNPTAANAGKHSNAGYFTAYLGTLNALTRNPDGLVKDQARITLNTLTSLINVSGSQSTTAAPPTQASAL